MRPLPLLAALVAALAMSAADVEASFVKFGNQWREQRFSLFSSNDFDLSGESLQVGSDGTVSLLWTKLPAGAQTARGAAWSWQVRRSVPATDLTRKGGDDRNLSLYFVFLPAETASRMAGSDILDLLDEPAVRVLMYVWGGTHKAGSVLPTPYLGERGRTIVLRPAQTGEASEQVNLAADHLAAFGEEAAVLVGLAVSADSDDTNSGIDASIRGLRLLP